MAPSIIFGCASIGCKFTTLSSVQSLLATLTSLGITHLDTAARYGHNYGAGDPNLGAVGDSEILLGQAKAAQSGFILDSKILFLGNGEMETTAEKVEASTTTTLSRLGLDKVNVMYIHAPDMLTPVAEQAAAMDTQFRVGRMEKLGISRFTVEMLSEYLDICREKGYVFPRVYQGQYSLVNRKAEEDLIPLLREERIRFVAFSPLASGLLTVGDDGKPTNSVLDHYYGGEKFRDAVERLKKTLKPWGLSATEAALRWIVYHSVLRDDDALILGASREEHIVNSMEIVKKGPLDEKVVQAVEQVWEDVRERSEQRT